MVKRLLLAFSVLALAVASAGTVPGARTNFKIKLMQPSVVNGTELKAGDYKLSIGETKVTITGDKQTVEAPAKAEAVEAKFDNTAICYKTDNGKAIISEIRLGGTKTKVVFN